MQGDGYLEWPGAPGSRVHSTAQVHDSAFLGQGCWIGPNVVIRERAWIGAYSVIGGMPEHRDFFSRPWPGLLGLPGVVIEQDARIFEFVTVHAGTARATLIGGGAAVFNHSHIAHDAVLEAGATVCGHASIAGFVRVMTMATVGGMSAVHQRSVIGPYAMLSFGAMLKGHIPPGERWIGNPAREAGLNEVGLLRARISIEYCRDRWNDLFLSSAEKSKP